MDVQPKDISALAKKRVFVTAPHTSNLWSGGPWAGRAYHKLTKSTSILPKHSAIYVPQYGQDWEGHRGLYATLEVLVYGNAGNRPTVTNLRVNTPFFLVPSGWLPGLLDGSVSERDILVHLEKSQG